MVLVFFMKEWDIPLTCLKEGVVSVSASYFIENVFVLFCSKMMSKETFRVSLILGSPGLVYGLN